MPGGTVSQAEQAFCKSVQSLLTSCGEIQDLGLRQQVLEAIFVHFFRPLVASAGLTIQPHFELEVAVQEQIKMLLGGKDRCLNDTGAYTVYQWPRDAVSGGLIPFYWNERRGKLCVGLITGRAPRDYLNQVGGYSETYPAPWMGPLLSEQRATGTALRYDRKALIDASKQVLDQLVADAGGDLAAVDFQNTRRIRELLAQFNVVLPSVLDVNSREGALRECREELGLDLISGAYQQARFFLLSAENTLGIAQGDAPGQLQLRAHDYGVFLGSLREAPKLTPIDTAEIAHAGWYDVDAFVREGLTRNYVYVNTAGERQAICPYMTLKLEFGVKQIWALMLQQASTIQSKVTQKSTVRFSTLESLVAAVEVYCDEHEICLSESTIGDFIRLLSDGLPEKRYTGKVASDILNAMLAVAKIMKSSLSSVDGFLSQMSEILEPLKRQGLFQDSPLLRLSRFSSAGGSAQAAPSHQATV